MDLLYPKVGQAVELMRVSLEGEVEQLTRSEPGVLNYQPTMSADGKLVVFGSTRDGARALYVANADGRAVRAITLPVKGRSQMHPHWRPHAHYSRYESKHEPKHEHQKHSAVYR